MKPKIKATIAALLLLALSFTLVGCGNKVSDNTKRYAEKAVSIGERFLNHLTDEDTAYKDLAELSDLAESEAFKYENDNSNSDYYYHGIIVSSSIALLGHYTKYGSVSDIEGEISKLKDYAN